MSERQNGSSESSSAPRKDAEGRGLKAAGSARFSRRLPGLSLAEDTFIEPHVCPDCDQECIGDHDGMHTCWDCGISF